MITGFNTDIEYAGVVYHVQTEDKGLNNPLILSLVYIGGTIIASKRTPYDDLIAAGFNENALNERLQRQHKLICAAIKAGRIEDLKRMGQNTDAASSASFSGGRASSVSAESAKEISNVVAPNAAIQSESVAPTINITDAASETDAVPPARAAEAPSQIEILPPFVDPLPPREASAEPLNQNHVNVVEELKSFDKKSVSSAPTRPPTTKERRGFRPVAVEAEQDGLILSLRYETELRSGADVTLMMAVSRAERTGARRAAPKAPIVIKILGTTFRPMILKAQTDADGSATAQIKIPVFNSGRAALLIEAAFEGDEVALRRIIRQA
jgi:hypothetical protein